MAAGRDEVEWVACSALPGRNAPPIELALAPEAGAGEPPFLELDETPRFARLLLGRVAVGSAAVQYLALKVQRDVYRVPGDATPSLNNLLVDATWDRERAALACSSSSAIVRHFDLGAPPRLSPLSYCRSSRRFFRPLCPATFSPLAVCRDDALLRRHGLEPYSTTVQRYLHATAATPGSPLVFYTASATAGREVRDGAIVRRGAELYQDGVAAVERGLPAEVRARLEAEHPIWLAVHGDVRAGLPAVEERLLPFVFYDSAILLNEALELHYDELCDLLGGAPPELAVRPRSARVARARSITWRRSAGALARGEQWLWRLDRERLFAHEVLHLKLLAFRQVCTAVRSFHAASDHAHLGLSPDNIMASFGEAGHGLPARWQFRVKLIDLGAQVDLAAGARDDAGRPKVIAPRPDAPTSFQSPLTRAADFAQDLLMQLTALELDRSDSTAVQAVGASAAGARIRAAKRGDIVKVTPFAPLPGGDAEPLYGTIVDVRPDGGQFALRLPVAGSSLPLAFEANVTLYRRYQAPCDLFALGMLLARALLVHDERDLFAVEDAVRGSLEQLAAALRTTTPGGEGPRQTLLRLLAAASQTYDSRSVLFAAADRAAAKTTIAEPIWTDLLVFLFRLLATGSAFGFVADADRAGDPTALMDQVVAELDELIALTRAELCGEEPRAREVAAVIAGLRGELQAALMGAATPPRTETRA